MCCKQSVTSDDLQKLFKSGVSKNAQCEPGYNLNSKDAATKAKQTNLIKALTKNFQSRN